jgi:predicted MFS family arabinose efflux permease
MFVNVPVGIAIIVLGLVFVRETETKKVPLDYLGAVLSTLVMAALIFGFTSAASDGWASAPALVSFAVGAIAVAALILVERRHPDAVVPLQLFGSMRAVSAYAAMLLVPAGLFAYFYFLALFVQKTLGYDALGTGFALLPYVLVLIAVSQLTPRLMPRLGEKWAGVIGIVLTAVGLGLLGLLTEGSTYVGGILVPSLILGIGAGISLGPLTSVVMHFAPSTHVSEASSMLQAVQQLGGGVGVAALTTLYVAGIGRGGAGAEGIAGGVSLAMLGGAGFAVVAFILYVIWGARVTPKAATAADVEAEVAEEAEREATLVD